MADIVYFSLPNGDLVSNDPSFDADEQRAKLLASVPNRGHEGLDPEELRLQRGASEEGDRTSHLLTGRDVQVDHVVIAEGNGFDPNNPKVQIEVPDHNEEVQTLREERQAALESGDDPEQLAGTPYSEWSGAALSTEVKRRGLQLEDRKKSTAVAALEADDEASRAR